MKLSELTEQLQQESNATIQQAQQTANAELNKFASDLKQQLGSAATTFRTDLGTAKTELSTEIENFRSSLKDAISKDSQALTAEIATIESQVKQWVPKMLKMVKWGVIVPVLASVAISFLMVAATWVWMPREIWNLRTSHQTMQDGRSYLVIDDPSWTTCNVSETPGTKVSRPCKTIQPEPLKPPTK